MSKFKTINCENCGNELEFWITTNFDKVDSSTVVKAIAMNNFGNLYNNSFAQEDILNISCDCGNPVLPEIFEEELMQRFELKYHKNK